MWKVSLIVVTNPFLLPALHILPSDPDPKLTYFNHGRLSLIGPEFFGCRTDTVHYEPRGTEQQFSPDV